MPCVLPRPNTSLMEVRHENFEIPMALQPAQGDISQSHRFCAVLWPFWRSFWGISHSWVYPNINKWDDEFIGMMNWTQKQIGTGSELYVSFCKHHLMVLHHTTQFLPSMNWIWSSLTDSDGFWWIHLPTVFLSVSVSFQSKKTTIFWSPSAESPPNCIATSVQRHGVESTQLHPRDPGRGDAWCRLSFWFYSTSFTLNLWNASYVDG